MRIAVVTGGRKHEPAPAEYRALHAELVRREIDVVRVGCATGVDAAVYSWVRGIYIRERWNAAWERLKRAAGPRRNIAMIVGRDRDEAIECVDGLVTSGAKAMVVLALLGGDGTRRCCEAAQERAVPVVEIR